MVNEAVKRLARMFVPARARQRLKLAHREFMFWLAMRRFLRNPETTLQEGDSTLADLIYGWGNEDWSALDEYLRACISHALRTHGPVMECGSGLSTILVGAIATKRGYSHWALEHSSTWGDRVQKYLDRYKCTASILCKDSLKDYGDFCWYSAPLERMPGEFSLVICDGPPGTTKGGRYGLVPIAGGKLKPGCVILLDDAGRKEEADIARRWETELNASFTLCGRDKPYISMVINGV